MLSDAAVPVFSIGRGAVQHVPPDGNLLWYVSDGSKDERSTRSQAGGGFHQAINDAGDRTADGRDSGWRIERSRASRSIQIRDGETVTTSLTIER